MRVAHIVRLEVRLFVAVISMHETSVDALESNKANDIPSKYQNYGFNSGNLCVIQSEASPFVFIESS